MAYEALKDTHPLMVLKINNLKTKIKTFFPVEPESKAFALESFNENGLILRDEILVSFVFKFYLESFNFYM